MPLSTDQQAEIDQARGAAQATLRPIAPALEEILYQALPVLDHGFVRVVDYMGDDAAVVQAARVSYGRGTKKVSEDRGLINYLMRHRHTTPFEMCEIKYHVKLPIFVARQWIRHRTANVNEYSARYSILDNEFYLPKPEHLAAQSKANRQGRDAVLAGKEAERVFELLKKDAELVYEHYLEMLNEGEAGEPLDPGALGPGARARAHEPVARLLYPVVLEDQPAQPHAFPVAARRRPRPVRDPRLCRRHDRHAEALVPDLPRRLHGIPHGRRASFQDRAGRGETHDRAARRSTRSRAASIRANGAN